MDVVTPWVTLAWASALVAWMFTVAVALRELGRMQRCMDASLAAATQRRPDMHHPLLSFVAIAPHAPGALTGVRIPLDALGLAPSVEDDFRHGRVRTLLSSDARTRVGVHVDANDILVLDRPFPWPPMPAGGKHGHLVACVRDAAPDLSVP